MKGKAYILLGPPGAGKGTQATRLTERLHAAHLSTGELLRAAIDEGNEVGKRVASIVASGKLVPTSVLIPLLEGAIERVPDDQRVLFDGYPRSREQAHELDRQLPGHGREIDLVLLLEVPQAELMERLLARGRSDDLPEVIQDRLDIYEKEIAPLRAYYEERGLLRAIDGSGNPDEVAARLLDAIEGGAD